MRHSLYLHPVVILDSHSATSFDQQSNAIKCLIQNQIIESVNENTGDADIGARLMEFIVFLGCSPTSSSDDLKSTIKIHDYPQCIWLGGDSIQQIRFPNCKHKVREPAQMLQVYSTHPDWACTECGNHGSIFDINWRKSAGYSNWFIEITAIFPKEALPSDALIDLLRQKTNKDWIWFYSRSSD